MRISMTPTPPKSLSPKPNSPSPTSPSPAPSTPPPTAPTVPANTFRSLLKPLKPADEPPIKLPFQAKLTTEDLKSTKSEYRVEKVPSSAAQKSSKPGISVKKRRSRQATSSKSPPATTCSPARRNLNWKQKLVRKRSKKSVTKSKQNEKIKKEKPNPATTSTSTSTDKVQQPQQANQKPWQLPSRKQVTRRRPKKRPKDSYANFMPQFPMGCNSCCMGVCMPGPGFDPSQPFFHQHSEQPAPTAYAPSGYPPAGYPATPAYAPPPGYQQQFPPQGPQIPGYPFSPPGQPLHSQGYPPQLGFVPQQIYAPKGYPPQNYPAPPHPFQQSHNPYLPAAGSLSPGNQSSRFNKSPPAIRRAFGNPKAKAHHGYPLKTATRYLN